MRTPVHIDSDAKTIVDADGKHIVVLMTAGTHADLERIQAALNSGHKASENSDRFLEADEYTRNREVLLSNVEHDYEWLFGDDTGLSAKAIWKTMYGIKDGGRWGFRYPLDPADLGRCIRLLRRHPEWVPRIGEMAQHGPVWTALVARWDDLVASYESEEPRRNARSGWSAPKTYLLMQSVLSEAREAS